MVEFLLDYYVWILAVLGIAIITIIGFLVDSKQKRKKKDMKQGSASDEVKTVEPLPEINSQDAAPIVDARTEQAPQNVDNVINRGEINTMINQAQHPQSMQGQNLQANPINVAAQPEISTNQGGALSGQKPHFDSREVPMPTTSQMPINSENVVVAPQPINAVPINQPVQPIYQQFQQQNNGQTTQQVPPVNQNSQFVNSMPINNVQPIVQPAQTIQNSQIVTPNVVGYNNMQPVNYQNIPNTMTTVQSQQPVLPINNVTVGQVATTTVQNPQQVSTPEQIQPQPTMTTPNIGISFVTGETSTNDDTWKL